MEASSPQVEVPPPALQEAGVQISKLWWLWLVFGFLWIVIALIVLQFDRASITTVGVLIGAMFLASGFQQLAIAGAGLVEGWLRWVLIFFGVLLVCAGVVALFNPEDTFAGVADVLGFLFLSLASSGSSRPSASATSTRSGGSG